MDTTWPTRREHLAWGTRDLNLVREHLDAADDALASLAMQLGRKFSTVRVRRLRVREALESRT